MAIVAAYNGGFALVLSEREFNELGFDPNREYEVVKAKDGLWVLMDQGPRKAPAGNAEQAELEKKILDLIRKKSLSERVEGKFEKYLNNKELACFQQLLKDDKVVPFKLNQSYTHGVYKLPEELDPPKKAGSTPAQGAASAQPAATAGAEKRPEDYSLDRDGFMIIKNEFEARRASEQLRAQIKGGLIKAQKTFDGEVVFVRVDALLHHRQKLLTYLKNKKMSSLENAAKDLNMSKPLIKVIAEFLKEDGELVEKRKGLYQIIAGYE